MYKGCGLAGERGGFHALVITDNALWAFRACALVVHHKVIPGVHHTQNDQHKKGAPRRIPTMGGKNGVPLSDEDTGVLVWLRL